MPAPIVEKLNREIRKVLAQPEVQQRFTEFGGTAVSTNPEDMGRLVEGEIGKWSRIVSTRKIDVQ